MNEIIELILELADKQINIFIEDGKLKIDSPADVSLDMIIPKIRSHKKELIEYLSGQRDKMVREIPVTKIRAAYELSSSQRRLWVLSQLEEGSVAYNMPGLYEFRGVVDVDALERAFRSLIARHESLRTVFREDDGGEVRQVILPVETVVFGIGYQDLRETEGGGSSAEAEGRVQARGSELAGRSGRKAFDLQTGPLLRAELYRTGEEGWLFSCVFHHIIGDGWSMGVLIKELLLFYNGFARGELYSLAPLRIQYKDYAVWQQEQLKGAGLGLSRRYWLEQFSGELPVLELAGDRRRPGVKTYQGGTVRRMIGGELGRGLKTLVQERGATLFMGLVSVVKALLYRYTQQEDIIIGSPVAGREHADLEGQIGCYVNTVALRTRFSGADSFEKLLGKVREVTMGAYEHQGYPFDRLVEELSLPRDMSRNPLFDVMVVLQNTGTGEQVQQRSAELIIKEDTSGEGRTSKFDLFFYFIETGETIGLGIEYNRDIYDRGTVERLAAHWEGLLSAVIGNPAMAVGLADYLGVEEKRELLEEFNATAAEYPRDKTITSLFEEQVGRTPERRALVYEDRMLTYRELNERSNALGNYLRRRHGIGAGDLVGLQLDRSEWLVIAILGVLKAGGAYVPIDPGYPAERIEYMIKDSGCKVVVDQGELGRFRSEAEWWDGRNVSGGNEPTDLLYVLYTSGSTGRPKGCMLEHRGVVNRLWWMWCHYGFSGEDLILQKTTYTFDVSVWELLLPLCWGAGMVICSGEDVQSPERIVSLIERWGVTCVHFVPGMLQAFISNLFKGEGIGERLRSVRQVIASGEALASSTVREWYAGVGIALDNLYGPTEASVDVSWHATKATETKIPIGRPIWNTRLYILDDGSQVVPLGVTGEIYIGGVGVGRGYLNKGELTAERFMVDPFCSGGRMYRTGDMGRWLSGGEIEFVGRRDGQVKIRGYRIEVGEIEAVLSGYAKVLSSAVLAEAGVGGELELRAYVVGREELSVVELRGWLGERVPLYMVPAHFEQVVSLPLTGNGKVDRKGLGSLKGKELGGKAGYVSPRTEVEREVVEVYEEVLKRTGIGIGDDFFVLGGDSIKSIQIVSRLRQRGYELSIGEVLRHPVLEEVSGRVRVISRSIGQGVVEGVIGLSPVQRYFLGGDRGKVDHYNQSVLLRSGERLSAEGLRAALGRLVAHHDALRMVYRCEGGQWVQENLGLEQGYGWEELRMEGGESWFVGECDRVQSGMELGRGPLLRVVLFRGEGQQGDRLLLVVHHLVIDGVSWRIVLEDLSRLYEQYERGEELRLPLKTDPFGYWQGCQEAYGGSVELSKQEEYWWGVEGSAVSEVPVEQAGGSNKMKDMQSCAEGLEEEMTERLQTRCHRAYRTEINDILLTGLVSALREELGMEKVLLTLEGHGREELGAGVDVTRTVGWFTTLYPVVLEAGGDGGLVERLIGVKECLHRVPGKGMGYGLLRYLKGVGYRREPSIRFNYLGEVGPLGGQGEGKFELSGEYHGRTVDGEMERGVLLEVSGMVTGGRLQLRIQYSGAQYSRGRMEGLVKAWRGSLEELIGILSEQEQEQLTPVDLTYKGLSRGQVADLDKEHALEDVYGLSPLQEGLYYSWLNDRSAEAYFMQMSYRLKGELDIALVERSYRLLVARHGVLRTFFTQELNEELLQVVNRDEVGEFGYRDLSGDGGAEGEREERVARYKEADRLRGFDLHRGSQMRLSVLGLGGEGYELVWSHHHILLDGWCMGILNKEFFEIYDSLAAGGQPLLRKAPEYARYINWLGGIDKESSLRYWQNYLSGYDTLSGLPQLAASESQEYKAGNQYVSLEGITRQSVGSLCRESGVTENVLIQTAWSILLGRYNNTTDVVFGSLVSGRPAELKGVEEMIGLFSNTIPVRIRIKEEATIRELLQEVQQGAIESAAHHYVQLADVQAGSELGSHLFDHLLVFQNFPVQEGRSFLSVGIHEQNNYNLTLTIIPGDIMRLKLDYNENIYNESQIGRLKNHLIRILEELIKNPEGRVKEISYLSEEEIHELLTKLNDTAVAYPKEETIVGLFEKQAAKTPGNIAVVFEDAGMTYKELNERSDALAGHLKRNFNTRPDDLIGIMVDRSEKMIIAILGVLKSGAAYVPIDPEYPRNRKEFIVKDANINVLLTQASYLFDLTYYAGAIFAIDLELDSIDISVGLCKAEIRPADLAYVIYTSGSTGVPKGVMIEHASIANTIFAQRAIFEASDNERHLQFASSSFDASISEIFVSLTAGATLYIIGEDVKKDAATLVDYITENKIDIATIPPAYLRLLETDKIQALKKLITAGEAPLFDKVSSFAPHGIYCNAYGPTESAICASVYKVRKGGKIRGGNVPIGTPVPNTQLYVLDDQNRLMAVGLTGELYIGGTGLARGYLNNPSLTAQKFIPSPFGKGQRIYKTGDLARWLPDGNLEFISRKDEQVKIRGYRIEPGEIEKALVGYGDIVAAVVLADENGDGEKELVAYIAGPEKLSVPDIKGYLKTLLPVFMLPDHYIRLESLPLTPSGKVDKNVLRRLKTQGAEDRLNYIAPRNDIERRLAGIWQELLGKRTIGVKDNFFDLGGHSLKATRLAGQIYKEFGAKVGLKELFENELLEEQAQLIPGIHKSSFVSIPAASAQPHYPLSSSQRRLWVLSRLEEANIAYNVPGIHLLEGNLDLGSLDRSFTSLLERHEILRTVFKEDADGAPRQIIQPPGETGFRINFSDLRMEPGQQETIELLVHREIIKPFDLSSGPLLRVAIYRVADDIWIISYVIHHIISDGWSMAVLIKELMLFYNTHVKGGINPLEPLKIQYKDYAVWQQDQVNGKILTDHKTYWLRQFEGELPVLELPADKPRPAVRTHNGRFIRRTIAPELTVGLKKLCQELGSTLFMGLVSVVKALLYRYTQQEDIIIGSPVAGREHADLEGQIGCYVNTLALRTRFSGQDSFVALLKKVWAVTMEAYEHQGYPFDRLVEDLTLPRDMSRNPLFDVMVVLQNTKDQSDGAGEDFSDVKVRGYDGLGKMTSVFDVVFNFSENEEAIELLIEYNIDIYTGATIERVGNHFDQLLKSVIDAPSLPLVQLDFLDKREKDRLLLEFNNPAVAYPSDKTLIGLFEEQAARIPDHTAVEFSARKLSYRELDEAANRLANCLLETNNIQADTLIGIMLDRSEKMLIAILGVLKCGAAYVPMDPAYPVARKEFILKDTGVKVLLTQENYRLDLSVYEGAVIDMDLQWDMAGQSTKSPKVVVNPGDLAYVIYTSGSTGVPKGVMIEHASIVNTIYAQKEIFDSGEGERNLQFASLSFDASVSEIFVSLASGGILCIIGDEEKKDPVLLARFIADNKIDIATIPPAYQKLLPVQALQALKKLVTAGEAAIPDIANSFAAAGIYYNAYGPTEASICASIFRIDKGSHFGSKNIPIGVPIPGVRLYILDEHSGLLPIGFIGEICIGGAGVARGYRNNRQMTAEKFVPDPYKSGERMYRTGDLGRWLPNGNIEFIGRKDDQVKIRGYRIEVAEIEIALQGHKDIQSATVLAKSDAGGEKRLVAYFVGNRRLSVPDIRAHLGKTLPVYMLPDDFLQLDAWPLTSSGKVDRKSLPDPGGPGFRKDEKYVAPGNDIEQRLAFIWQEVLGVERIGIKDNFFERGGHSLKAIRLAGKILRSFGVKLELRDLFTNVSLEDQARLIGKTKKASFDPVPIAAIQDGYVLSSSQRRLWILSQFEAVSAAYNIPGACIFEGKLDRSALMLSFKALIGRHEILRTMFKEDGQGIVKQYLLPVEAVEFSLEYTDLRMDNDPEAKVRSLIRQQFMSPFDLGARHLLLAHLYQVSESRWVLGYVAHHIVCDGWSMGVFIKELRLLYNAYCQATTAQLPPLQIQYKDYAVWQQSRLNEEAIQVHKNYWINQFEGDLPVLDLQGDHARPLVKTYTGSIVTRPIRKEITHGLKALCQEQECTLFVGLLAGVYLLLHRYTGEEDIIIGSPVAGREHPDLDEQIGFYVNVLPLRVRFDGTGSYKELLADIRQLALAAYEHQAYPFDELVQILSYKRDTSRHPLFDVAMVLQNKVSHPAGEEQNWEGLEICQFETSEHTTSKFDLLFAFSESEDELHLGVEFNTDIYERSTIERLADNLTQLFVAIIEMPSRSIGSLDYMNAGEKEVLLSLFNDTAVEYPEDRSVTTLFEAQVSKAPDKIALVFRDRMVTYGELNERSNRLADYLRRQYGIGRDQRVGIRLERSDWLMIAILGILKSGGAYVPLDPGYPEERIAYMQTDSGCKLVIDEGELGRFLGEEGQYSGGNGANVNGSQDLAYVMYTSGTTGRPKGVMVEHRSVVRLVRSNGYVCLSGEEVLLSTGAISFDSTTFEYWGMLLNGGRLIFCSQDVLLDGDQLGALIRKEGVDTMWFTSGWLNQLINKDIELFRGLRTLLAGGDALSVSHIKLLRQCYPDLKIINGYGPTENTTFSLCHEIGEVGEVIPVGRPISNSTAYILDERLQLCPVGITGEICVGGDGLARGYINQAELTAEKFVGHPFKEGERLYRTGDLGRWLPDGTIVFEGRKDDQVKIRGYRVEPGEVEEVLRTHPAIETAAVAAVRGSGGDRTLTAYVVSKERLQVVDIRSWLRTVLPSYMIPGKFVQLAALPLTSAGKIDRKRLPEGEDPGMNMGVEYIAPRNETEEKLVSIWRELLGVEQIGIKDNFFELGGHSLNSMQLIGRIRKDFDIKYSINKLFSNPTIEDVANEIEKISWANMDVASMNNIPDLEKISI